ncbi:Hypothetical protein GLP15_92 [Giardia lamblia P15]|uniref:Uncharacterized protein n=1 Tax=Giardia intestinalis (strain P15) TaxID=658858 RepID=E1F8H1_GIAIA|nr:Hypothetical protein GLP15_92 [Giardia lamblia P15]
MRPRTIRYVLGRYDIHKVHNNCDPIRYITSHGMRAEPSFVAHQIEDACEKSFVAFERNKTHIPIVLAPSKHYHVSGLIQELTPELTPVSLTPSEEDATSDESAYTTDNSDNSNNTTSSSNHNFSQNPIQQELHDNSGLTDLIEDSANVTPIDLLTSSKSNEDVQLIKAEQSGLQLQVSDNGIPSVGTPFSYAGASFKVNYEESVELNLLGRLMAPSIFMKLLDLGKSYAKGSLQSAGIHKPQDVPLRIALELVPIIISLLLADPRYLSDLLHAVDLMSIHQLEQCQTKFVRLLTNGIIDIRSIKGTKFCHTLLTPPSSAVLVSHTIKILSALICDSLGSERHTHIYSALKKIYPRSDDLTSSRSAPFTIIPLEPCPKLIEDSKLTAQYIENIPWIVRGIIEVIFLEFYSIHDIRRTVSEQLLYSSSLNRMYNVCTFILACLFIRQYCEAQSANSTMNQHTSLLTMSTHQDILLLLGASLLGHTKTWLKESLDEYHSSAHQPSILEKLDRYIGDWGTVNLFLRSSLLQLATIGLASRNEMPFKLEPMFFLKQSINLIKADASLTSYYSGDYLDSGNLIGYLLGLITRPLTIDSQRIMSIYLELLNYFGANSKCTNTLVDVINTFLKFRYRHDSGEATKIKDKLGKEIAYLYEKIRKPLMDSKGIAEVKTRRKTSNQSPPMFICFLLTFISHILLRSNSVIRCSIHVFLKSLTDAAVLLYPLALYKLASKHYGGKTIRLTIPQSSNLSSLTSIFNDMLIYLENSSETEPEIKKKGDTASKFLTISLVEAKEILNLTDTTDPSDSQREIKIYVHTDLPNHVSLSHASLITNIPCQFAVFDQLITCCDKLSTLIF